MLETVFEIQSRYGIVQYYLPYCRQDRIARLARVLQALRIPHRRFNRPAIQSPARRRAIAKRFRERYGRPYDEQIDYMISQEDAVKLPR